MEEGMTGVAIGAALVGDYPITTHIRADFSFLAMNQIVNLASKYTLHVRRPRCRCPMLIRMVVGRELGAGRAAFAEPAGDVRPLSWPDGRHAARPARRSSTCIRQIINRHPGPVVSIEHRLLYNLDFTVSAAAPSKPIPLTSYVPARRKRRHGRGHVGDGAGGVARGPVRRADKGRHDRPRSSISNSISHPDWELVTASVRKTGRLVMADTSWLEYGVAGEVCRQLMMRIPAMLRQAPAMLGMAAAPCPTAKSLEDIYYPSQHETVEAILAQVRGSGHGIELPVERSMTEGYKRFRGPFLATRRAGRVVPVPGQRSPEAFCQG